MFSDVNTLFPFLLFFFFFYYLGELDAFQFGFPGVFYEAEPGSLFRNDLYEYDLRSFLAHDRRQVRLVPGPLDEDLLYLHLFSYAIDDFRAAVDVDARRQDFLLEGGQADAFVYLDILAFLARISR